MNNIIEWFGSGLKLKRYFLLIIAGVAILSYSIAKFISSEELQLMELVVCIVCFVLGFTSVIMSFVLSQRRILKSIAEANASPNGRNINLKKLLFDKKMLDKNIKVVAIGSGDGLATLLKGLKLFSNNITAIVTAVDDEENSNDNTSIQDVKKAMISLASKEDDLREFFNYRVSDGMLRGANLGNVFFELVNGMCDQNKSKTIEKISNILSLQGNVIPSTLDNVTIGAVLTDGTRVIGKKNIENRIEERKAPIESVFLVPERCTPAPEVVRSIKEADVIIIGPGSLYTGILPALLIKEIADSIRKSSAIKIYVSNIMTEKNQTDGYALSDYINMLHENAGKGLFDHCIFADSDIMPEYVRRYNKEGSDLIDLDRNNLRDMKLNLVVDDIAVAYDKGGIRHDPEKLAQDIFKIVCDNMDLNGNDKTLEYYTARTKLKKMSGKKKKKNILFSKVKIINAKPRKKIAKTQKK